MKQFKIIFSLILVLAFTAGCSPAPEEDDGSINIVASFAPVYAITQAIADGADGISVSCMAANSTGCLHDYQITSADMKAVESADLYIIGGAGMEGTFLDRISSQYPELKIVDSSSGVDVIAEEGGENNPHIWLSTVNASQMAKNIADALSSADPDSSQVYAANLESFRNQLAAAHDEYAGRFAPLAGKKIVTFHEAFEYLGAEFGLEIAAVIEVEPGTAPDPQTLSNLISEVKEDGVSAIFTEPQYPDDTAKVISGETGIPVYTLDPIVTGEMNKDSFVSTFRENLEVLIKALG